MANPPGRHHYVPQFYLRGWTSGSEGKLWRYARTPADTLHEKTASPKETAFEPDLYTFSPDTPLTHKGPLSSIETTFFQQVDMNAAQALHKLTTTGITSLSEDERTAWAIFLNSLLERSPQRLDAADAKARAIVDLSYETMQEGSTPDDQARFSRFLNERVRAGMARNAVRFHMTERIRNEGTIAYFKRLRWRILRMSAGFELITSDAPIVINTGQSEAPLYTLAVSLSPEKLFLLHPTEWKDDKEGLEALGLIALVHNLMLLDRPCKYVYSRSKLEDGEMIRLRKAVDLFLGRNAGTMASSGKRIADSI